MAKPKHEDKALKSILQGREVEKKIQVGGYDKEFSEKMKKEKEEDRRKSEAISKIMSEIRMPMFCPECQSVMTKRLDKKMWYRQRRCFNCVVEEENEMRIKGTYREYEKKKVRENALAWLKDEEQGFNDWKKDMLNPKKQIVNEDGTLEEWQSNSKKFVKNMEKEFKNMKKEILKSIEE